MDSRPRKTTLESFNEELAILDRPIEGEVEYYDERPPQRRRWPGVSAVVIGFVFAGAGALFFSHQDPETIIAAAQAAAATAPTPPPSSPPPPMVDVPAVPAPAVAPAPPPAVAMEPEPATEAPKWRQPPPRTAWTKLRLRSPSPSTP